MGVIRGLTRPLPVPGPLGVPGPYQVFPGTRLKTTIDVRKGSLVPLEDCLNWRDGVVKGVNSDGISKGHTGVGHITRGQHHSGGVK